MRTELCFEDRFVVCSVFIRGSIYPHSYGDSIRSWDTRTASETESLEYTTNKVVSEVYGRLQPHQPV